MAATTAKHVATENVMSFEDDEKPKRKFKKRKQPFVKISYDSGSDADAESDDDNTKKRVKKIKRKVHVAEQSDEDEESGKENKDGDDAEEEGDDAEEEVDNEPTVVSGAGWADAMSKILGNEAPEEKPTVLGKSKEYAKKMEQEEQQYLKIKAERESHKHWENLNRVKPKVTEREHERSLQRTATRGVVQLFNAVKKQQKFLEDKLKDAGSETKRIQVEASISKGDFLDLLKGPKNTKRGRKGNKLQEKKAKSEAAAEAEKPMWSVLRDDFMMGAKMKDWDKSTEEEDKKVKAGKR